MEDIKTIDHCYGHSTLLVYAKVQITRDDSTWFTIYSMDFHEHPLRHIIRLAN
jgi:hypothetical protein